MQEKENVISILERAKGAIKEQDSLAVKDLSNRTIHTASIYQDPDNINIAVILYALSKIIERKKYQTYTGWSKFEKVYVEAIGNATTALKKGDIEVYRDQINRIREVIGKLSGSLKSYIEDVFRKASINKASKIYEHGVSLEKTAKILGITQWELSQYVGQATVADINLTYTEDIKDRIKITEELFR